MHRVASDVLDFYGSPIKDDEKRTSSFVTAKMMNLAGTKVWTRQML
jgi:hypothetical protein